MKNKTLSLNDSLKNLSQKKLFAAWIFYHAAVLIFFLASIIIFRGKIGIDSDLFNLVPKSISMASVKKADDKFFRKIMFNLLRKITWSKFIINK